ncbi:tryptophan transporter [Cytobacillus sp. S13-E01]|uniref:tryptophan transporter n=1 Tax=Cytobacillus sp. S13-E01 TaxID=3031326 RepID=UPI0023D82118|nr:tryptophan transporter [Cytobacillus sp. S13-E01]MDF0726911.1 tryptophan transporter [Cytobacillus sp. S13-E01]
MNTRVLVLLSLLVGMGAVLHAITPPLLFGMKPDLMLTMMFLGILLFPSRKNVLLLGLLTGIISALTTGFPSGQIPNLIDKPITAFVFLGMFLLIRRFNSSLVGAGVLTAIGTIISGSIFLGSALLFFALPGGAAFSSLFIGIVLPTAVFNTVAMVVIFPIVQQIIKRTNLASEIKI